MKAIKKLFGIKTTYAIPSDNGVDITKWKKYKVILKTNFIFIIKDNANVEIVCNFNNCNQIHFGSWEIITE